MVRHGEEDTMTTATESFLSPRDFLPEQREDRAGAYEDLARPRLRHFDRAPERSGVIARWPAVQATPAARRRPWRAATVAPRTSPPATRTAVPPTPAARTAPQGVRFRGLSISLAVGCLSARGGW
ncbi:hypothetical protein GCM10010260_19360 [Streptomyces filipinensis]|uniref:Uncharacterized protein n=1 Tax=Streptomyces filipinensis TaxID=66887 RepID=A0A918I894_9ACTN|nr:hypothetical protein GCM10010260_19360 [Streptomyces filipinensis]